MDRPGLFEDSHRSTGTPRIYTIPSGLPFADVLASGLLADAMRSDGSVDPIGLAGMTVLLPTRRSCRTLREAFLRASAIDRPADVQHALLLPRITPIGDIDEDEFLLDGGFGDGEAGLARDVAALPPPIPGLRRQMLLSRLILAWGQALGDDRRVAAPRTPDQAARLARELARLLDRVQTERLSFDALSDLVPEEFAAHWQLTLHFLRIVADHWPAVLESEGAVDPATHRNMVIAAQAEAWRAHPPTEPVMAAGSTGSIPATADLIAVVAGLPLGCVVLPGLDLSLSTEQRAAVADDPSHPQHGMLLLLRRIGADLEDVRPWPVPLSGRVAERVRPARDRAALLARALRPAAAIPEPIDERDAARLAGGREGLMRIAAEGEEVEANAIALMMREALEDPTRTVALVTADRTLARRVCASLSRYGLSIDDSAGRPLAHTPSGTFFRLVAQAAFETLAPVPLLALCKHPLARGGAPVPLFRDQIRALERHILRGPRPRPGLSGLRQAIEMSLLAAETDPRRGQVGSADRDAVLAAIEALESCLSPFLALMNGGPQPVVALLRGHVAAGERLSSAIPDAMPVGEAAAAGDGVGLWHGEDGEALAAFVADVERATIGFPDIEPRDYPALIEVLLSGRVVRPRYGSHPRLAIWGPLEARLQAADLTILGGLNEGVWPPVASVDPWMSRPMQQAFGLPLPERRIGLSAHDFVQAASGSTVVLTRSTRSGGTPTVPSRWLLRLEALLEGLDTARRPEVSSVDPLPDLLWRRADDPARTLPVLSVEAGLRNVPAIPKVSRPVPRPPVSARPARFSVTEIERWMRDPYALYAHRILRLEPLPDLDERPGAAERGSVIHDALDRFVRDHPGPLPADGLERLLADGRRLFAETLDRPSVWAFWWPRFEAVAKWFIAEETIRRPDIVEIWTETRGRMMVPETGRETVLTGKADRLERRRDGSLVIVDYKTGQPPSHSEIFLGLSPQLSLEAAMAAVGAFEGIPTLRVSALEHWRLSGGSVAGEVKEVQPPKIKSIAEPYLTDGVLDIGKLGDAALAGLSDLVRRFEQEATPYAAQPFPDRALKYNDYEHLARIKEWAISAGDDE